MPKFIRELYLRAALRHQEAVVRQCEDTLAFQIASQTTQRDTALNRADEIRALLSALK